MVVGAVDKDASAGAAYEFVRDGTIWTQQAYLKASNADSNDWFGFSVSISGDTIVVGANYEASGVIDDQSDNNAPDSGAAYVFVRNGTTWAQQAYLKASNIGDAQLFGCAVSISGDIIVVGAIGEDAAYVFVRHDKIWTQQICFTATNPGGSIQFGASVSISGDVIVVGAQSEHSNATGVNGDQNNDYAEYSRAAYVFVKNDSAWTQQAYLKASNTYPGYDFGTSVSISGDTIVVGSSYATGVNGDQHNFDASYSGPAYIFVRAQIKSYKG